MLRLVIMHDRAHYLHELRGLLFSQAQAGRQSMHLDLLMHWAAFDLVTPGRLLNATSVAFLIVIELL